MTELTGTIFDAKTGKALGTTEHTMSFDSLNVYTEKGKPKIDTIRETRIEYAEALCEADKKIVIETFMTFKELRKLCAALMGVDK